MDQNLIKSTTIKKKGNEESFRLIFSPHLNRSSNIRLPPKLAKYFCF